MKCPMCLEHVCRHFPPNLFKAQWFDVGVALYATREQAGALDAQVQFTNHLAQLFHKEGAPDKQRTIRSGLPGKFPVARQEDPVLDETAPKEFRISAVSRARSVESQRTQPSRKPSQHHIRDELQQPVPYTKVF